MSASGRLRLVCSPRVVRMVKAGTGALCRQADVAVESQLQTIQMTGCGLDHGTLYFALVYVEDDSATDDGTLSLPLDIPVPAFATSNAFLAYPSLVLNALNQTSSSDGITLSFTATNANGRLFAMVVDGDASPYMTVRGVKFLQGALCNWWNIPIADQADTVTLSSCLLEGGKMHRAYVYVEGEFNEDDGTMAPYVEFTVPRTNGFADPPPHMVPFSSSPDNVMIEFAATAASGNAWVMVVGEAYGELIDNHAMRAGTYSVGAPSCRKALEPITEDAKLAVLGGCSFQRGLTYTAFVYVEGTGTTYADGTLSERIDFTDRKSVV